MAHHTFSDRTLALAGVFQSAGLVHLAASRGSVDPRALEASIHSLFETNPDTTEAVFGGVSGVRSGLNWLVEHLTDVQSAPKSQMVKYVIGVLYLERRLAKQPALLDRIGTEVERARQQSEHFSITHSNVLASLAGCYSDNISPLTPRIIVTGEQGHLSNPEVANMVRALLLAGIRSAVLWRQCGGNRFQLLLGRRKLLAEAKALLTRL